MVGELGDGVFYRLRTTVDDVATLVLRTFDEVLHEATETREVGGDRGDTHYGTFSGSVTPRFVVTRENTQMASTNELFIVQTKNRVVGVEEIWVEDNLDTVVLRVKQLDTTNLVENRVASIVSHVVSRHRRERVALKSKDTTLEENLVFLGEKTFRCWKCSVFA